MSFILAVERRARTARQKIRAGDFEVDFKSHGGLLAKMNDKTLVAANPPQGARVLVFRFRV